MDMRSLLLFDSLLGPFLSEISLAARYGVFIVVFPHLSKKELLCLANSELASIIEISHGLKAEAGLCVNINLNNKTLSYE